MNEHVGLIDSDKSHVTWKGEAYWVAGADQTRSHKTYRGGFQSMKSTQMADQADVSKAKVLHIKTYRALRNGTDTRRRAD
jgi:hypothetical protein